ncbi:hypothetical protein RM549_10040 [Salegentibacter sp. F188]|uniref:Uncharacterized protein n=1 Tax=Autumnicola patrickiae TaxID=3075591 RepID=A0ABU3E2A0_9FLAO|nr:hypothetical protein [Salegentibacter sp. F188]MDT0690125.1 hypothetical protein [Salegentibacter sp. F188]
MFWKNKFKIETRGKKQEQGKKLKIAWLKDFSAEICSAGEIEVLLFIHADNSFFEAFILNRGKWKVERSLKKFCGNLRYLREYLKIFVIRGETKAIIANFSTALLEEVRSFLFVVRGLE